jgi:hypothetical protein
MRNHLAYLILLVMLISCNSSNKRQIQVPSQESSGSYSMNPVDQRAKDPSLEAYINLLQDILKNKDTARLFGCFSPDIKFNPGGELRGIKGFKFQFAQNNKIIPEFWVAFERMLKLGGAFTGGQTPGRILYTIPYPCVDSLLPPKLFENPHFDIMYGAVCVKEKVSLYEKKDSNSSVIGELSYELLDISISRSS